MENDSAQAPQVLREESVDQETAQAPQGLREESVDQETAQAPQGHARRKGEYRAISMYMPPDVLEKESRNELLSAFILTWAGCYIRAYGHAVESRVLTDHVLIYCVDGAGWLRLAGRTHAIGKGDVFVCPPGMPHAYGADDRNPWTKYWLHFRGHLAASWTEQLRLTPESPVLPTGDAPTLASWFQDIFTVLRGGYTQANLLEASVQAQRILAFMARHARTPGAPGERGPDMERIVAFLLENVNESLTLERMADHAGLSKYHFSRRFREMTGYSPVEYHNRLRMQKACELLAASTASVAAIGAALGYANPYYFSTTFKRIIGQSPKGYRDLL